MSVLGCQIARPVPLTNFEGNLLEQFIGILLHCRFPPTSEHLSPPPATRMIFVCAQTQCFITAMDALKLEQRAVDEVQPLIYDLSDRLNKVSKANHRKK